jgi:hypothetical protein
MFDAKQIKKLMTAQPFKPFRICMSDGKTYDITNHHGALVTRQYVDVGVDYDQHGIPADFAYCAISHITRIQDLQAA